MAKKKEGQQTPSVWGAKFKEIAERLNDAKRGAEQAKKQHVGKIPKATLFINGKRIILNG